MRVSARLERAPELQLNAEQFKGNSEMACSKVHPTTGAYYARDCERGHTNRARPHVANFRILQSNSALSMFRVLAWMWWRCDGSTTEYITGSCSIVLLWWMHTWNGSFEHGRGRTARTHARLKQPAFSFNWFMEMLINQLEHCSIMSDVGDRTL